MANDRNVLVYMNAFCVYVWHTQNTCECFVLVVGVPLRISLDAAAANCCSRCTKSGVALSGVRESESECEQGDRASYHFIVTISVWRPVHICVAIT